jgi:hypothetical protein
MAAASETAAAPAKTGPGPRAWRTTPATAGPTRIAIVSMLPAATLAAVSSAGVREREGRIAACTGRVSVIDTLAAAASA